MSSPVGFIALARPTFDVDFAAEKARQAHDAAKSAYGEVAGSATLMMDLGAVSEAASALQDARSVVVFQATFADSTLISELDRALGVPLLLWATPEPRSGGRLRLNSFCGINLAGYALAQRQRRYTWLLADPADETAPQLLTHAGATDHPQTPESTASANLEAVTLEGSIVGVIGDRPDGFEPCDYDVASLRQLTGVTVQRAELSDLFAAADDATDEEVSTTTAVYAATVGNLGEQDQEATERSIRLHLGMKHIAEERAWDGIATRCWPECFTEYGGAACAPMSLVTSQGIPGTCEADVYGNVTSLLLSAVSGEVAFVADLVDIDTETNTVVFWHCGLAPLDMADPASQPEATVHSNRRKPLLYQFSLRPGPITIARLSQSQGRHRLVVGTADMVAQPPAFSGTSGVARVANARSMLDTIMANGLEHHYGLVYGDHTDALRAYAASIDAPVVELSSERGQRELG